MARRSQPPPSQGPPGPGIMNLNCFFSFGNEVPINPLPSALSTLIESSKSDRRKPSELPKHFLVRVFKKLIPVLKQGRTMHWYSDKEDFRELAPFRMEFDLLPRLRRRLVDLSQIMDQNKLKTDAQLQAVHKLLHQISIDATQLKMSVSLTWDPSKYKGSKDNLIDIPLYYYPDLPWGVDHVRDSIADLFKSYSEPLAAGSSGVKDTKEDVKSLLDLMDHMIGDLKSPRLAMQAKWRWMVREVEVMDHAVIKCLKPQKVRVSNPLEGLEDDKHLEMTQWRPRETMADHEVRYVQLAMPIFRLGRLLLNKLSRPTNSNPSLTSRMTLTELNELYKATDTIDEDFRVFAQVTLQVSRDQAGHILKEVFARLQKPMKVLNKHFNSLGSDVNQDEVKDCQQWCKNWMAHLQIAVQRCLEYCVFDDSDPWETESD
ncbi:hypothetical protein PGT21_035758 [Puccinia graminis f. sp. tritici]|uniref:Uncharacterized protein n=1 Tax=Puccinia graminis f. sp. tritici TaxID=56615 RepID=A0A5B0PNB9_PUCGR|nr:hypothetical protein PGT21_035758 [Puccinia graminis f. sp. tritici]